MPAPAPLPTSLSIAATATRTKVRAPPSQSKKTRIVRRRGRAKTRNAIGSDDEIEREVATDSESEDDQSSLDSASDSDTEPASEDVLPNGHSQILPPNDAHITVASGTKSMVNGGDSSFFDPSGNWSEMVAEENANGPADLPVIDFADFDGRSINQRKSNDARSRRAHRVPKLNVARSPSAPPSAPSPPESVPERQDESIDNGQPVASTSPPQTDPSIPKRAPGQSARQAYQHRLESDPSYVPTVGEFWGHDDRLLDKDLRSLSGWWRGRWQGRGRGRGGFPMRGRGRGGYFGEAQSPGPIQGASQENGRENGTASGSDVPPIERTWTHDGFEEMRQKDGHRHSGPSAQPVRGVGLRGGRGGFVPGRGRGGFTRGGLSPSSTGVPPSPSRHGRGLPFIPPPGRPWFAMKPERVWTKQHDGFLHFDPALKPRPGQGPGFRVKLPGHQPQVIRAPVKSYSPAHLSVPRESTTSVLGSDEGEKTFVVRIPKRAGKKKAIDPAAVTSVTTIEESSTTMEGPPMDDIFTVRPLFQDRTAISHSQPSSAVNGPIPLPAPSRVPDPQILQHAEQSIPETRKSDATDQIMWTQTEEAISTHPTVEVSEGEVSSSKDEQRPAPPTLPPLRTSFSPISQPSPSYASPFGYSSTLPPGIAMNQHGMAYEISTGRPVYLQPPPMYTHRPVIHTPMPPGLPFVPSHIRHHSSVSPDFLAHAQAPSHTPPINGFIDPSTGTPIFSLPRQSSRIEIRPPTDQSVGKPLLRPSVHQSSGLRLGAAAFEPSGSQSPNGNHSYFPPFSGPTNAGSLPYASADIDSAAGDGQARQGLDPSAMTYPSYQQPYYYPAPYDYSQYMDMSQAVPYEMYTSDPRASHSAIYY